MTSAVMFIRVNLTLGPILRAILLDCMDRASVTFSKVSNFLSSFSKGAETEDIIPII